MARGNQTFQKRQREIKLRERAQQKRERRQQKQAEKKQAQGLRTTEDFGLAVQVESAGSGEAGAGQETGAGIDIAEPVEMREQAGGLTLNQANRSNLPQIGGTMASRLFVGNLPREITDSALASFVTDGGFQVASAVVIRDRTTGDSKGFGFVELAEGEDLQRAIRSLDGQMLENNRLNVNEARPQRADFSGPRGGGGGGRGGYGRGRGDYRGRGRGY